MQGMLSRQSKGGPVKRFFTLAAASCLVINPVFAGPEGGVVVGGEGSIDQQGLNTTINQASQRLAVDWDSFNVSANDMAQRRFRNIMGGCGRFCHPIAEAGAETMWRCVGVAHTLQQHCHSPV